MSFQEMTLEALWANEPDHDWMVGDCPDKKCSEWYKLHTKWLNEVNHRFRLFEAEVKTLKEQKDTSYNALKEVIVNQGEQLDSLNELYDIQCKWYDFLYNDLQNRKAEVKDLKENLNIVINDNEEWQKNSQSNYNLKMLAEGRLAKAQEWLQKGLDDLEDSNYIVMMLSDFDGLKMALEGE